MAGTSLLDTSFKTIELTDAKIAKLTADVKGQAAPTYAAVVDLPGSLKITVSPKMSTKELYGDSEQIDQYSKINKVELDVECSMFSLDALAILIGGTVTTTAESVAGAKDSKIKYSLKSKNTTPPFFKMEGQWTYVNDEINAAGGDAHVVVYKCKVTDPPEFEVDDASGNFGTCKFKATAVACRAGTDAVNGTDWYDIILNQKRTDIA